MHLHLEFRWGGGSLAQPQLGAVQATFRGLVNFECALRGEKEQVQSLVISHRVIPLAWSPAMERGRTLIKLLCLDEKYPVVPIGKS